MSSFNLLRRVCRFVGLVTSVIALISIIADWFFPYCGCEIK